MTWKKDREHGNGSLLSVALHVKPARIDILWQSPGEKMPYADKDKYKAWLSDVLASEGIDAVIQIHPCENVSIMNFASVYAQIERLATEQVFSKDSRICINASAGTWMMSACWIAYKKSSAMPFELYASSREEGVEPVDLPAHMTIRLSEAIRGKISPLMEKYRRGELAIGGVDDFETKSEIMREALINLDLATPFDDVQIMLLGPPGVGKTTLAERIHRQSGRKGKFVPIDCGMLAQGNGMQELWGWVKGAFTGADKNREGRITDAKGGTLFLDEIGNADPDTQQNLLRLIQNKSYRPMGSNNEVEIDIRIIAATNADLHQAVEQGKFRQDLLDRLLTYPIKIPSLRERPEDIVPMAKDFLRRFNDTYAKQIEKLKGVKKEFSHIALDQLILYRWPGNIRELENTVARLAIKTISAKEFITAEDVIHDLSLGDNPAVDIFEVPHRLPENFSLEEALKPIQAKYLEVAYQEAAGNKSKIAKRLGFGSRSPLERLIKELTETGYWIEKS